MNILKVNLTKAFSFAVALIFLSAVLIGDLQHVCMADASIAGLPPAAQILSAGEIYESSLLRGLRVDYNNPLNLEFIFDTADESDVSPDDVSRLINYFFTSLAMPSSALWVNLSPYEQDRIVNDRLGTTEMGRDLLGQDYILKQLSASLTHPDTPLGKTYWSGLTPDSSKLKAIQNEALNKIWITPESGHIKVQESNGVVWIEEAGLNAMTEADYLAMSANAEIADTGVVPGMSDEQRNLSILLPEIKQELNQGRHFTVLRQIYNAMILGAWFKKRFKESFYAGYIEKENTAGIELQDQSAKHRIFELYRNAFEKGAYNFIRKTRTAENRMIKQRYFSGGFSNAETIDEAVEETGPALINPEPKGKLLAVSSSLINGGIDFPGDQRGDDPWADFDADVPSAPSVLPGVNPSATSDADDYDVQPGVDHWADFDADVPDPYAGGNKIAPGTTRINDYDIEEVYTGIRWVPAGNAGRILGAGAAERFDNVPSKLGNITVLDDDSVALASITLPAVSGGPVVIFERKGNDLSYFGFIIKSASRVDLINKLLAGAYPQTDEHIKSAYANSGFADKDEKNDQAVDMSDYRAGVVLLFIEKLIPYLIGYKSGHFSSRALLDEAVLDYNHLLSDIPERKKIFSSDFARVVSMSMRERLSFYQQYPYELEDIADSLFAYNTADVNSAAGSAIGSSRRDAGDFSVAAQETLSDLDLEKAIRIHREIIVRQMILSLVGTYRTYGKMIEALNSLEHVAAVSKSKTPRSNDEVQRLDHAQISIYKDSLPEILEVYEKDGKYILHSPDLAAAELYEPRSKKNTRQDGLSSSPAQHNGGVDIKNIDEELSLTRGSSSLMFARIDLTADFFAGGISYRINSRHFITVPEFAAMASAP